MSKGLVVVHDPHNLYQFVWYYCSKDNDPNKQWDALCLPNGYKGEYMHTDCEKTNIFSHIYRNDTDFSILPVSKKIKIFAKMLLYFICGQRTRYCRKFLSQYVNIDDYDELVVICDVGIVTGACIALGKEKKVVILEDGTGDYIPRYRFMNKTQLKSLYCWQCFLLALMGYSSPERFKLSTNRNCIKYCSMPSKIQYADYREIRQLYDNTKIDRILFDNIVKKMYPIISLIDFNDIETIVFTKDFKDFVLDSDKYKERLEKYIQNYYDNVLIKKHPRENQEYNFGTGVKAMEIDKSIPAEALMPYIAGKEVLICSASSVIIYTKPYDIRCKVLDFDGMYEESFSCGSKWHPFSPQSLKNYCDEFTEGNYEIVNL